MTDALLVAEKLTKACRTVLLHCVAAPW